MFIYCIRTWKCFHAVSLSHWYETIVGYFSDLLMMMAAGLRSTSSLKSSHSSASSVSPGIASIFDRDCHHDSAFFLA